MSRGISLHVGVNAPGRGHARLDHSEQAAWRMAELASQAGYHAIQLLRGPAATRDALLRALAGAAEQLGRGDTLLVSFSGHGATVPDRNRDERDDRDETWCLSDDDLLDDELAEAWRALREGVRVVVVAESCFSGGGMRGDDWMDLPLVSAGNGSAPPEGRVMRGVAQTANATAPPRVLASAHREGIGASLLVLTAGREAQKARDGLFTRHLLDVWNGGGFRGSFHDLHCEVARRVQAENPAQEPRLLLLGAADESLAHARAFHLDQRVMRGG